MNQDENQQYDPARGNDKTLNKNMTSAQASSNDDDALHCVNDLIRQILATFEEENLKQSEKQSNLLKQLNKPKQILVRLDTINVVKYLDEVNGKTYVSAGETGTEENKISVNVNEDLKFNTNDTREMTESSLHSEDLCPSSGIFKEAKSRNLGEKGNGQNNTVAFCVKDISQSQKQLSEKMSKELKIIQKIELYVNELVKEVVVVFERENLYAHSRKEYQCYESPEILKKTKRSTAINEILHDSKTCQVSTLSQTKKYQDFVKHEDPTIVPEDSDKVIKSEIVSSEYTNQPTCVLKQKITPPVDYLYNAKLSSISDDEDTDQSQEQTDHLLLNNFENENRPPANVFELTESSNVYAQSDYLEETRTSPEVLPEDDASKDNLEHSALPSVSFGQNVNTVPMNLEYSIQTTVENEFSLKRTTGTNTQHQRNISETSGTNTQHQRNINEALGTNTDPQQNIKKTPGANTRSQPNTKETQNYFYEAKEAAESIKNIVQILMRSKQDSNAILHDLQIITYFIDAIGFLNDQLKTGIVTIFLEQRELNRTTSCVYESYVLLHFKRLSNLDINGIDVRVFGKDLLQDLKNIKIKTSLLFREYNLFRLKFLQNSLKFASIPFEFFIGDSKNSWIVSLAKSAAEKIVEEFKNKDELEDMHKTIVAERQKVLGYAEEFYEFIVSLDEISKEER